MQAMRHLPLDNIFLTVDYFLSVILLTTVLYLGIRILSPFF
jgi:hypothetical protein